MLMELRRIIRMPDQIRDADGIAWNHKVSLYNGSVMMLIVRLYYYAPWSIQRYHDMRLCRYAHMSIKRQRYDVMLAYNEKMV